MASGGLALWRGGEQSPPGLGPGPEALAGRHCPAALEWGPAGGRRFRRAARSVIAGRQQRLGLAGPLPGGCGQHRCQRGGVGR